MTSSSEDGTPVRKILIPALCALGILGVGYGMAHKNNPVFVVGILFVIAGYLLIRRRLRASVAAMEEKERNTGGDGGDAPAPREPPGGKG